MLDSLLAEVDRRIDAAKDALKREVAIEVLTILRDVIQAKLAALEEKP